MYPVTAQTLLDLLGSWAQGTDPLNEQLADALARAIESGSLAPGTRLPSERDLAAALGLSRTTIVLAYDRLRASGLVRSRQGSGTRVAVRGSDPDRSASGLLDPYLDPSVTLSAGARSGPFARSQPGLAGSEWLDVPPPSDGSAPIELTVGALRGPSVIADIAATVAMDDLPGLLEDFGYRPLGLQALRVAVAALFDGQGVPTDPEQIVITSGAQQALDIAARALVGPGGAVVLENPTYVGMVDALRAAGARMLPVPLDRHGLRVDIARAAVAASSPAALYVVPTYQNPTGRVLPEDRRRELAALGAETGTLVIEDLTPDVTLGRATPPPIAAFDRAGRVVTVGSLSKAGWGGLRVGWLRLPMDLVRVVAATKTIADHGSTVVSQAIARRLLDDPGRLADRAVAEAASRRVILLEALAAGLPDWEWAAPEGGLSLWVRLPGVDAAAFARLAAEHGVIVRPGAAFSPDGGFRDHIRIAYGEDPDRLRAGVDRLATAWTEAARLRRSVPSIAAISV